MNKVIHPMEKEELMAYLDGELSKGRAAVAAAHLSECAECRAVVDGLRMVSNKMRAWEVAVPETGLAQVSVAGVDVPLQLADALEARRRAAVVGAKNRTLKEFLQGLFEMKGSRLAWAGGLAAIVVALTVGLGIKGARNHHFEDVAMSTLNGDHGLQSDIPRERGQLAAKLESASPATPPPAPAPQASREAATRARGMAQLSSSLENSQADKSAAESTQSFIDENLNAKGQMPISAGPMIIRTADLKLTTKEIDKARAAVENILKQRHGYVGDLTMGGAAGGPRTLTATLRVPADQLDGLVVDLKTLGHVDSESQGGQDVTSQYVDLKARLGNAQNTEKRLTDLLNQRTGKLSDVLQVEQELDRVRGEIEQMEAQRKTMANQISFATLSLTVSKEYKAQLEAVPPTTWTRLRNAAVDGYRSMVDGIVSVFLFFLSSGPSLLLWCAVLFFPARGAWRIMRRRWAW